MKYTQMKRSRAILGVCAALCLGTLSLYAQLDNLFGTSSKKSKSGENVPTVINSDAMDMDMANDKIILLGNVDVQDDQMNIKCRKMTIYLGKPLTQTDKADNKKSDKKAEKKDVKKADKKGNKKSAEKVDKKSAEKTEDARNGKSVIKIECVGDVVITQKNDAGSVTQQAFAGKAIYFAQEAKIILQDSPVVIKDGNRLEGEKITLFTKTDRVLVVKPVSTLRGQVLGNKNSNE